MAEEVVMTPVEGAEPPKVSPIPAIHKTGINATQPTLRAGLKLPPKPGLATAGLKLPTQSAIRPGLKLPPKPVIRKPGATIGAKPLPKPIAPAAPAAPAPAPAPTATEKKNPTATVTSTSTLTNTGSAPITASAVKPMDTLKSVTQKLKGITQQIPQQAILRKTGIIADEAMSEAQKQEKQAAKSKTARISLSEAMGVAPVKNEAAPMKTIRIKRPTEIPGATDSHLKPAPALSPAATATAPAATPAAPADAPAATEEKPTEPAGSVTQRKTLRIARPGGGAVRPTGKFGIKRPTVNKAATGPLPEMTSATTAPEMTEIADIPDMPVVPEPTAKAADDSPVLTGICSLGNIAACLVMGVVAYLLFQATQTLFF